MKQIKKTISIFTTVALVCALAGCANNQQTNSNTGSTSSSSSSQNTYITDAVIDDQFALPNKGEEYAVISVEGYGDIKARLFDSAAPKAVENFKTLAKNEAYNGVPFHRIVEDFMIQTGDTTLNGGNGESIYGKGFAVELNQSLHHYSGALAVARTSSMSDGQSSQFYIVSNNSYKNYTKTMWDQLESKLNTKIPEDVRAAYNEHGGSPSLDMQYTIFGQVFEGQEIVDKISQVPVQTNSSTGEKSSPITPVIVSKVQILTY